MANQLAFNSIKFDIINRKNQIFLTAVQLAKALGYKSDDAVTRIYSRNEDEFSPCMSEKVSLTVSGNLKKEIRIFSLRGAHLIAMLAKTEAAKAFRKWVLDILDRETESQPKALPETLTPAMQRHIQKRVNEMTLAGNGLSFPQVYRRIKDAFHVGTYKDIPAKKYPELCRFLNCKPEPSALQGELLERETLPAATGNVNIPGNGRWLVIMENGNATVRDIHDKSVVDFQLHRKLQHDAMYASAMLSELSKRLRITSGECSASEFNVSLEDKFNA